MLIQILDRLQWIQEWTSLASIIHPSSYRLPLATSALASPAQRDTKAFGVVQWRGCQVSMTHHALSQPIKAVLHMHDVPALGCVNVSAMVADRQVVQGFGNFHAHGVQAVEGVEHIGSVTRSAQYGFCSGNKEVA